MTVLVLGASGYTGRAVTRAIVARGLRVHAFIRRPEAEQTVRAEGADAVTIGDLRDLATVAQAARGADGIFFIGPRFSPEEAEIGEAVIAAAVRAGVRRFVLSGVYHPTIRSLVNHRTKRRMEDRLYATDLEFTLLQPARFMHPILLSGLRRILEEGVLADFISPDVPMSYVDYRDVAEVTAIAFAEDRLVRGTFELCSAGEHTHRELAEQFGRVLGREVRAEQVPLEQFAPAAAVLSSPYSADGFRRMRDHYDSHGFRGGNALVLRSILGREPTTFVDCLRHFAQISEA